MAISGGMLEARDVIEPREYQIGTPRISTNEPEGSAPSTPCR